MLSFFGLEIHLYGLIIGLAIWIAIEIFERIIKIENLPRKFLDWLYVWAVLGGVIGARIYHVVDFWDRYYSNDWTKILFIWEGGLGIWGAIIGGILFILMYGYIYNLMNKNSRVNLLPIIDRLSVVMPMSQMVGRLGNWVNGELWGKNGEPLFLYEGALNLILFFVLLRYSRNNNSYGRLLGIYLVVYGLIRLTLENLRPEEIIWKSYDIPVAIIFATIAILLGLYFVFGHNPKRS